jgi:type IV pilus assembly protein PilC
VSFGDDSRAIPSLLKTITARQDRELIALVEDMKPVLEALMIAIMAALVGGVIIALYLPIFGMSQTLTRSH